MVQRADCGLLDSLNALNGKSTCRVSNKKKIRLKNFQFFADVKA